MALEGRSSQFFHHLVSLLVRIAFVWFGIPVFGIRSCLWGMLASEVLLALLHILALRRITAFEWNAWTLIGKPVFCLLCALWIFRLFPEDFPIPSGFSGIFSAPPSGSSSCQPPTSCFCCFSTGNRSAPLHKSNKPFRYSSNSTVT